MAEQEREEVDIGREKELDELVGRAQSAVGAVRREPDALEGVPLSRLSHPGRAPVTPAGSRAARPATSTLGTDPGGRHNWVSIGPRNVAGRMRGLACADPATALIWYAGSAGGGVWKTIDGGRRWRPLWHDQPSMEIAAIAVAPSRPQRVYAATGETSGSGPHGVRGHGVFVIDDQGPNPVWTNHGAGVPPAANPAHRGGFEAVAVHPTDHQHCWAVGVDGAFRTLDGGVTWQQFEAGTHLTDVAFSGTGPGTRLYLVRGTSRAGEGAVLRLDAPGAAAAAVTAALAAADSLSVVVAARPAHLPWPAAGKLAIAPSNPDVAYVRFAGEDERHIGLFRTNNARAALGRNVTWTRLRDHHQWLRERQGTYDLCVAVDPTNPARVATGMVYLHVSANATAAPAAVRWQRVMGWELHDEGLRAHHADQHHLVIAGAPPALWVADDGGIARCPDWATAATIDHGQRFRRDPVRPVPPGAVRWQERDSGISGAQMYDLAQSPLVPTQCAGGLQDNGVHMRAGGLTWRMVFGADGGFCAFDPDDPYRLLISYYGGLVALQFPALLDRLFADGARDPGAATFRFLSDGLDDDAPFVPETARHPTRGGRILHAREGRLYGVRPGAGERFTVEPAARSFELRCFAGPPAAGPTDLDVVDTPGAVGLGLTAGRRIRRDRTGIVLYSRLPAPYRLAEGDELRLTLNGAAFVVRFRAADGIDPARVQVRDVLRLVDAALPGDQAEVHPLLWDTPSIVQLSTRATGPATTLRLGGSALAPLADGLSRLGLNAGTYGGDAGRPASVLLGFAGFDDAQRQTNRDLRGAPALTIEVAVGAGPARVVRVEPPAFPDPAHVATGELSAALATALAADPVDVAAIPAVAYVELRADPGTRVVLTGTAADRLEVATPGALTVRLGNGNLVTHHRNLHHRNRASVDLVPPGLAPLELVISDGAHATAALRFTAADVADLRAVTVEELHRLIRLHLAAHPAVTVQAELVLFPLPGAVSALAISTAHDGDAWAGVPDGGLFVTHDDGVTWDDVGDPRWRENDRPVAALALHPTDPSTLYVGLDGEAHVADDRGFLFRTRTGGPPWELIGHRVVAGRAEGVAVDGLPLAVNALELDPAEPRTVFAATDAGVFRSTDAGDTWTPAGEGLPNAPVTDITAEPTTRALRASVWTRGVFERRIGPEPPADVRLAVRATELDDGRRPARQAPSLATPAPAPLPIASPDVKVVRRRPDVGTDAELDGVPFDLDLPHDDVVGGSAAEVVVQVANLGALTVPQADPPPADQLVRVVALWAPADTGPPPLPAELWMRLRAGPLAGTVGDWNVAGDGTVPRAIRSGDTGIRSFAVNWPALDGIRRVGILVLATAKADPLDTGPLTVGALLAAERRAAYREVAVCRDEDDRTLVLRSTDGRDIVVEQPAAPVTGVADRLGFAAADLGVAGLVRVAAPAAAATYDLSVAGPGVLVRSANPLAADLNLLPQAHEASDPADVDVFEAEAIIQARATAAGLPVQALTIPVGLTVRCRGGAQVRVTGGAAAARLGWAPAPPLAARLRSTQTDAWFNLTGTAALNLEVQTAAAFPVAVDLAEEHFADPAVADPNAIAQLIRQAMAAARLDGLVSVSVDSGIALRALGQGTVRVAGAVAGALGLPAGPAQVLHGIPPGVVDLHLGPVLRVEVTPRVVVRFDGDPADIPDLAHAHPGDVRRAINLACEIAGVPARAEVPSVALRVASSPADTAGPHAVAGGTELAELAASRAAVAAGAREALFAPRTAIGRDTLATGVNNHLYLRVTNHGNVGATATRLRLFRIDLGASPIAVTAIANAVADVPTSPPRVEEFTWDPTGAPGRTELVLAIADQDRPGRRVDPPAGFATPAEVAAFAQRAPSAALRSFDVVAP